MKTNKAPEQYISKSAVVAEIERLIERAKAERVLYPKTILAAKNYLLIEDYKKLLSIIDTLEVKEVDLNEEISNYLGDDWRKDADGKIENEMIAFAKHFFDFGLFSQLTWKDIKLISEIGDEFINSEDSDSLNDEEYYTEILNRFKTQKGE